MAPVTTDTAELQQLYSASVTAGMAPESLKECSSYSAVHPARTSGNQQPSQSTPDKPPLSLFGLVVAKQDHPPLICAHGGDTTQHPPNTAAAYKAALKAGADCMEIDAALTSDLVLVALHDRDLQQLLGQPGVQVSCTGVRLTCSPSQHHTRTVCRLRCCMYVVSGDLLGVPGPLVTAGGAGEHLSSRGTSCTGNSWESMAVPCLPFLDVTCCVLCCAQSHTMYG